MAEPVEVTVRQLVAGMAPQPAGDVTDGQRLVDDLHFDSLTLIELAVALERRFDLPPISDDEAMDVVTVADVVALVSQATG
ncbi:acyl carrier protein [Micromonospora humida]|uniref:acyl carrier protein n=1 Tax=Micromonospora humida TaxID=2809018 RepID=UPI0034442448